MNALEHLVTCLETNRYGDPKQAERITAALQLLHRMTEQLRERALDVLCRDLHRTREEILSHYQLDENPLDESVERVDCSSEIEAAA